MKERTFSAVKAGQEPEVFATGAVRDPSEGKGRFDLVPDYAIRRLAIQYENGAKKYADRNWEKGLPLARFISSAQRHLADFKDNDRTEDHLAAVLWNVAGYIWTEREIREGRLPMSLADGVPWDDSLGLDWPAAKDPLPAIPEPQYEADPFADVWPGDQYRAPQNTMPACPDAFKAFVEEQCKVPSFAESYLSAMDSLAFAKRGGK